MNLPAFFSVMVAPVWMPSKTNSLVLPRLINSGVLLHGSINPSSSTCPRIYSAASCKSGLNSSRGSPNLISLITSCPSSDKISEYDYEFKENDRHGSLSSQTINFSDRPAASDKSTYAIPLTDKIQELIPLTVNHILETEDKIRSFSYVKQKLQEIEGILDSRREYCVLRYGDIGPQLLLLSSVETNDLDGVMQSISDGANAHQRTGFDGVVPYSFAFYHGYNLLTKKIIEMGQEPSKNSMNFH